MLIIPLLAVSLITQVAVLAAPIPLNDASLKAREPLFNDEALFSRSLEGKHENFKNAWKISNNPTAGSTNKEKKGMLLA